MQQGDRACLIMKRLALARHPCVTVGIVPCPLPPTSLPASAAVPLPPSSSDACQGYASGQYGVRAENGPSSAAESVRGSDFEEAKIAEIS